MRSFLSFLLCILASISVCASAEATKKPEAAIQVEGRWITEQNGSVMLDPQTSGLVSWRGGLLTLSDRSAHKSQRLSLRKIDQKKSRLQAHSQDMLMKLSDRVTQSCFADYLRENPDLEALAVDPDDDRVMYVVTEDAADHDLSPACKKRFAETYSTDYPSLLVRLELQADNSALMTHVRPIQFSREMHIGNYPNDGVEALAFASKRTLYLGLEKDDNTKARIFSLTMNEDFWSSSDFIKVTEPNLKLPIFEKGNHPINGMDYYQHDGRGYLLAAARNDNTLWIIDLAGKKDTFVAPLQFLAELQSSGGNCQDWELMKNASIEGVAVIGQTLWMINDPWKKEYLRNVQCPQNVENYGKMAPLLFALPIKPEWFQ
jgi:hypothetical protein